MKRLFYLFLFIIGFQILVNSEEVEGKNGEGEFIQRKEAVAFLKLLIRPFNSKLTKETYENFEVIEEQKYFKKQNFFNFLE